LPAFYLVFFIVEPCPENYKWKNMKAISTLSFAALILITGCRRDFNDKGMSSIEILRSVKHARNIDASSVLYDIMKDADCIVDISTHGGFSNQEPSQPKLTAFFQKGKVENVLPSTINNNITLTPLLERSYVTSDEQNLINLFGRTTEIILNYKTQGKTFTSKFTHHVVDVFRMPPQDIKHIYVGKKIIWIPSDLSATRIPSDTKNKTASNPKDSYIMISISLYPIDSLYKEKYSDPEHYNKKVYNTIILNDSCGNYTFTKDDLKSFPPNAILSMEIFKGRFSLITDENSKKKFFIGSYSMLLYSTTNK